MGPETGGISMVRRWGALALMAVGLSACGAAFDADHLWNDITFWQDGKASEGAMAALGKGDFAKAEGLANDALHRNPQDPYAILALGVVFENTARPDLARQYFSSLVSMNPQVTAMVGVGPAAERRTLAEIGRQHLAALASRPKPGYVEPPAQPALLNVPPPPGFSPGDIGSPDEANIILRFQTLRQLLDEGLITRDEYNERRGTNLGALLPYTAPPAAVGLTRPAPEAEQLVHRLRYLAVAFEERGISAREQAAERTIILEALMPAQPGKRNDAPPVVKDQLQAAAVVGRLERLRSANVITAEEQSRESAAVFKNVQAYIEKSEAAARIAAGVLPPEKAASMVGAGVQLGAFHSEAEAQKAWAALQKAYPTELGALQFMVKAEKQRRRGTVFRLKAGPVADRKAAVALCRQLSRKGQTCAATVLGK